MDLLSFHYHYLVTIPTNIQTNQPTNQPKSIDKFWLLLGLSGLLMILEDAGNVRHILNNYFDAIFDIGFTVFHGFYFLLLAIFPLCALLIYGYKFLEKRYFPFITYLLLAYIFYGISQISSATARIGNWYVRAGRFVTEKIFAGQLYVSGYFINYEGAYETGIERFYFLFMDDVYEETLQLFGALFLFLAAFSFMKIISQK